jgi:hypothetical protein
MQPAMLAPVAAPVVLVRHVVHGISWITAVKS